MAYSQLNFQGTLFDVQPSIDANLIDFKNLERQIIDTLKINYKLSIEEACFAKEWIPKHIILDRTRNIHSYVVFAYENEFRLRGRYFAKDYSEYSIVELIRIQYSQLDRPLFIIIIDNSNNLSCIEGSIIREYLLEHNNLSTLTDFLKKESVGINSIIKQIKMEL